MVRKLPHKDVAVIGLGWTGSILANELTDAGLDVVAIERGPWRDTATDFLISYAQDELRYRIQHELFLRPSQMSVTFRNNAKETALPVRTWGAFMLGNGAGGAGVHWNAETWRFLPTDFAAGVIDAAVRRKLLPQDMTIQDWGITYDELEPHYDEFEYLCGTPARPAISKVRFRTGGNPFEGPRSRPYPTPPMKQGYGHTLFARSGKRTRLQAFSAAVRQSVAVLHQSARRHARSVHLLRLLRMVRLRQLFESNAADHGPARALAQTEFRGAHRMRGDAHQSRQPGKRATGVTYVDASGEEFEQPADLVLLCAFSLFNVQLLLLSGIGKAYDPHDRAGADRAQFYPPDHVIGASVSSTRTNTTSIRSSPPARSAPASTNSTATISTMARRFRGWRLYRRGADQWSPDRDHGRAARYTGLGFEMETGAARQLSEHAQLSAASCHGSMCSYRDIYLDLDPTYKDRFGRPLMRITIDFHDNELKMSAFLTDKYAEILQKMGAKQIVKKPRKGPYDVTQYQTSHLNGGAIMGDQSGNSALNRYLQSWDVPNLFVQGASAFPQNAGYNPTGTVGALAFWSAARDPFAVPEKSGAARPCIGRANGCSALLPALRSPRRRSPAGAAGIDKQNFEQVERGHYLADGRRLRRLSHAAWQ